MCMWYRYAYFILYIGWILQQQTINWYRQAGGYRITDASAQKNGVKSL